MKTLKTNYLGKKYLEQCQKITIKELFDSIEKKLRKELLDIELDGIELIKTKANYGGDRCWFKCPICGNKTFTLYHVSSILKCRKCSGLKYRKQRFKGMIEEKIGKIK